MIAYAHDEAIKRQCHASARNYGETYLAGVLDLLGVRAARLSLGQLESPDAPGAVPVVLIGSQSGRRNSRSNRRTG